MNASLRQRLAAEFFGTYALVFAGTGAIIINDVTQGTVTHPGVALTFGLIVMAMIYAIGDISGAHINPAVTVGLLVGGEIKVMDAVGYIVAQLLGGLAGAVAEAAARAGGLRVNSMTCNRIPKSAKSPPPMASPNQ